MPFLLEEILMLEDRCFYAAQFGRADVAAARQSYRLQPVFALAVSRIHMDVRRFRSFVGIEMEAPIQQT